ncbi:MULTISPECIES: DUF4192 family protein [unclassified Microbacterium]|uniref:DUF4192 family protein n=1 Tax=Microbacterium sp. Se63.02b TaxID=2709304 RepID=UPI001FCE48C3|nr:MULTISPECIES: DUF4192 family protein [unclassified Microbacterium]
MTTVLRATDSAAFLGLVPALAGFTPHRSIVLLPFRGARTEGAMRLDLPHEGTPLDHYADGAVGLLSRVPGTDAMAAVVYTDGEAEATRDGLVLPHVVAVEELLGCAEDAGLRVIDALCVTPSGWSSYIEAIPELRSLDEICTPADVSSVADVSGDQASGVALPVVDLAEKERVGRALLDVAALLDPEGEVRLTGREHPELIAALALLEDIPAFFESALTMPGGLPPSRRRRCCGAWSVRCSATSPSHSGRPISRAEYALSMPRWRSPDPARWCPMNWGASSWVKAPLPTRVACASRSPSSERRPRGHHGRRDPHRSPRPRGCPGPWGGRLMPASTSSACARSTPDTRWRRCSTP